MNRRSQIGALSFLLTLVWAAGLCAAVVGGRIGQHPSTAVALAAAGAFCAAVSGLMLTLACYPGLAELLRPVAQLAAVCASLDAAAVLWAELPWNDRIPDVLNDLEFSNFLLLPSMIALLASSVLFFTRWFSNQASRSRFQPMGAVQSTFLLFRRHHRLLGWVALAFAGAHWFPFLLSATALLIGLCLAGVIHLKLVSGLVRLQSGQSALAR